MAKSSYTVTEVKSDLSNEVGAETVQYAVGGTKYEIDLTKDEGEEFLEMFQPYIAVSRVKGSTTRTRSGNSDGAPVKTDAAKVREWAEANGYEIKPTGRVPNDVREAFDAAHAKKGRSRKVADEIAPETAETVEA